MLCFLLHTLLRAYLHIHTQIRDANGTLGRAGLYQPCHVLDVIECSMTKHKML